MVGETQGHAPVSVIQGDVKGRRVEEVRGAWKKDKAQCSALHIWNGEKTTLKSFHPEGLREQNMSLRAMVRQARRAPLSLGL